MSDDAAYWRAVAIYLADCHAATAVEASMMKSMPKSRMARFRSIAATAAAALRGDFDTTKARKIEAVIARCEKEVMP